MERISHLRCECAVCDESGYCLRLSKFVLQLTDCTARGVYERQARCRRVTMLTAAKEDASSMTVDLSATVLPLQDLIYISVHMTFLDQPQATESVVLQDLITKV